MKTFIFLTLLLAQFALAVDEFKPQEDIISEKYEAGHFLIYNCEEKHWVCVRDEQKNECEDEILEAKQSNPVNLPCASFGKFPTKQSCFQRQLFLVSNNFGDRFCINDSWKEKEIRN